MLCDTLMALEVHNSQYPFVFRKIFAAEFMHCEAPCLEILLTPWSLKKFLHLKIYKF